MQTLTREVTARQFRSELASLANEASFGRGRIGLHRYGRLVAVLIGVDDFQRLRRLESKPGALDAEESLDDLAIRLMTQGRERVDGRYEVHEPEGPGSVDLVGRYLDAHLAGRDER